MSEHLLKSERLDVVDALRGFALLAIVLLHNLEHYNIYHIPEGLPDWLLAFDKGVWDTTFFLLAGKAFSTFSLLFGFSFFIQMDNQARRGNDFRGRFAWRLLMLMLFAQLHALFYNGDILMLYAVCGFSLLAVCRLSNKAVFIIATILLLQPFEWGRMLYALIDPSYTTKVGSLYAKWGDLCWPVGTSGTFLEFLKSNITDGQLYSNVWQIENGRLFQVPALFMFGMLLGRKRYFVKSETSVRFWKRTLIIAGAAFAVLYFTKMGIAPYIKPMSKAFKTGYSIATGSYLNFLFMCVLVSMFTLFWFYKGNGYRFQRFIIPYGRMSLTNYITQSIIGCTIYYHYGFNLWKSTGASVTILIGLGIFALQWIFSQCWLSHFKQGPLEYLWKKLTWINSKRN